MCPGRRVSCRGINGGGRGGNAEGNSKGSVEENPTAKTARCSFRRDVECTAMRDLADPGRVGEVDTLPAREHFRAIAPLAKAEERRIRRRKAPAQTGKSFAWGGLRNGLGVSALSRDSQKAGGHARTRRCEATLLANCGLLNCLERPWKGSERSPEVSRCL